MFGNTMALWFREQNDEERAAKVELSRSAWRALRNHPLLEKARMVATLGHEVLEGSLADEAADYGITEAEFEHFTKEIEDYGSVISAPQQGIAERKALTRQLGDVFNEAADCFDTLDKLILHFSVR